MNGIILHSYEWNNSGIESSRASHRSSIELLFGNRLNWIILHAYEWNYSGIDSSRASHQSSIKVHFTSITGDR